MLHARIATRALNTPLLIEPSKAMAFLSGLGPRILGRRVEISDENGALESTVVPPARASILAGGMLNDYRKHGEAPYPVVDGIAVIEISGVLIHRGGWIGQSSGQTSYEGIAAQIEAAANDPAVRGLALEIDSFGGEVAGVFDLADRIRAIRATKPVWAFVAEHAFSAGYALASQATRILLPRTGALGSIGVVVMHADLSGQLDQDGMRITLVHSGNHKVDGNPYEPLPAEVRHDIQREIDVLRFLFTETVAAGRAGRLSQDAAMATEAATYRGADAIAAGLADEVTDLARGFAAFAMYSGCVLDQLSWQMQRSGLLTATARLVAQGETIAAATAAGTPTALGLQRFGHFNGTVKRNGTALGNVVSAEITYANNLDRIETIRGDGRIDGADPTMAALTGRIEVRFSDNTLVTQAIDGTPCELEFNYSLGANASFTFTAHAVYLPIPRIEIAGPQGVQASFDWQAAKATSPARMCTAVLVNSLAGY